eukprot:12926256-Prorocentrum_lima.AAC.1
MHPSRLVLLLDWFGTPINAVWTDSHAAQPPPCMGAETCSGRAGLGKRPGGVLEQWVGVGACNAQLGPVRLAVVH